MDTIRTILESIGCGARDWWAFAGDPLISGSVFMLSYGLAAWQILRVAARSDGRERQYWRLCGWLFAFQVLNTNLDLHGMIFTTGRCLAKAQGWYEDRREVQMWLLFGLAMLIVLVLLLVLTLFARNIFGDLILTTGMVIALGFTLVKGINFHGLERYYAGLYGPFRGADLIELSGIALALLSALARLWRTQPR